MRMIVRLSVILTLAAGAAFGQDDDVFRPMKGSATPSFLMTTGNGRCLVFGTHIVKTTQTEDGGENVSIWHREGTAKGAAACDVQAEPYATIKDSDNNAFYGISAVYLFIDAGTSAGSRTLLIFKTDSGDEVTSITYNDATEPRIEAARYLYYDAPSDKKGPPSACKDAAKWKREGGSVGWIQAKKMDLDAGTITKVGVLRCVYMQ